MPKDKITGTNLVSVSPGGTSIWQYSQDDNKFICRICLVPFEYAQSNIKFRVNEHPNSAKHQIQVTLD